MQSMKRSLQKMAKSLPRTKFLFGTATLLLCCGMLLGCHPDMWNQPRYTALQANETNVVGAASLGRVPGTISYDPQRRDWINLAVYQPMTGTEQVPTVLDSRFYTGKEADGSFVANNYFDMANPQVAAALLARGQERFNITCAPCHGASGNADGLIIGRGFPKPTSYHIDRIREVEDGYIFDVITNGFGRMYSYGARVQPEDRWAIAAYIRALQFSQNPDLSLLSEDERNKIENPPTEASEAGHEQHGAEHNAH